MRFRMTVCATELLLTLTRSAGKCQRYLTGVKGAAFLGHFSLPFDRRTAQFCSR
jgi:hypothetical protein